jgi:hypothetical protein
MSIGYKHDITNLWLQCFLMRYILFERHVHQPSEIQQIQLFLGQHKIHADVHTWQENLVRGSIDLCTQGSKHVV